MTESLWDSQAPERDLNNNPLVAYTRGNDLSGTLEGAGGIGGLLARSDGYSSGNFSDHNFYHADENGNIMYLVNSSQTLAASYRYDPFGNLLTSNGSLAVSNTYRFSSKEFIPSIGLYYYLYRFYDPSLQRWINRDPIGEQGFQILWGMNANQLADGENQYMYVRNGPVNEVDPVGLAIWSIQDLQAIINNLSQAMEGLPVGSPEWRSAYAARAALYQQLRNQLLRKAALGVAGRVCLVAGAAAAGVEAGNAIGNSTPYAGGGTINQAVTDNFVWFWNWWYGYK